MRSDVAPGANTVPPSHAESRWLRPATNEPQAAGAVPSSRSSSHEWRRKLRMSAR